MKINTLWCRNLALAVLAMFVLGGTAAAQRATASPADAHVRSSPAFAELLLRKAELQSELEALRIDYTEEFPRVIDLKHELGLIDADVKTMLVTKPEDSGRLTLALGKLLIKRAELETQHWKLLANYKEEHPDVKRAKERVGIYDQAIKEILGN